MFAQQDNEPPPQHVGEVVVTTAGAEFNAVLQAGHEVEGLLLDAQGEPLAGGQVLAAPLTGAATIIGEADGQGRFTLRLAAGEYRLLMVGPTFDVIWRATQFQVPHPELLVAQQPGGALVQGQVTDGDGVPSGALVFLTSRTRPWVSVLDAATAVSAFVGPDGRFSAEVEPGTYSLIALPDESGVGTGRLTSIELQAGDVLQADVALPSGDGNLRVTGQLRTAGTAAGAHFGVFYDEASGVFAVARVEAGRYAIDLPAGEYAVSVFVVSYFQDALGSYEMGTVTIDTDLTYDLVLADALSAVTDAPGALPESFHLDLAFPNPFNAQVTIPFALPGPALVTVTIHDILGQTVRQLRTAALPAGWHALHWDGTDDRHRPAASGVYLYRMKAGPYAHSRRFTLLR
jgi:hypothetical protein